MNESQRARMMRASGTLGIVGVILFVGLTFFGGGNMPTIESGLHDPFNDAGVVENPFQEGRWINLASNVLAPLLFLAPVHALQVWMTQQGMGLAGWLGTVGKLALFLWVISGLVFVLVLPATAEMTTEGISLSRQDVASLWYMLGANLYDMGYFVLAFYMLGMGLVLRAAGYGGVAGFGWTNGLAVILIYLFGPYDRLSFFVIYAYGAPIVTIFAFAAFLLLEADKLDNQHTTVT